MSRLTKMSSLNPFLLSPFSLVGDDVISLASRKGFFDILLFVFAGRGKLAFCGDAGFGDVARFRKGLLEEKLRGEGCRSGTVGAQRAFVSLPSRALWERC